MYDRVRACVAMDKNVRPCVHMRKFNDKNNNGQTFA